MQTATTQPTQRLYLAFELSRRQWKLGFSTGFAQAPRVRVIAARDLQALEREIQHAKQRLGLPVAAEVWSCYEAGRDGFWIHRALLAMGVQNRVVDSSSIEVNRRSRRAKADRLDVGALLRMLMRYAGGETKLWSIVRVPTPEEEDARQLHRELMSTTRERTRVINRIRGLLAGQGVVLEELTDLPQQLDGVRLWDGSALATELRARLGREWEKVRFLNPQLHGLEHQRLEVLKISSDSAVAQVRTLMRRMRRVRATS